MTIPGAPGDGSGERLVMRLVLADALARRGARTLLTPLWRGFPPARRRTLPPAAAGPHAAPPPRRPAPEGT